MSILAAQNWPYGFRQFTEQVLSEQQGDALLEAKGRGGGSEEE